MKKESSYFTTFLIVPYILWTKTPCAWSYTTVLVSSAASHQLEKEFLSDTTTQYLAGLTANPLVANTYTLILYGHNPKYQAPPSPPTTLEEALQLGGDVYVYGFANGMGFQQQNQIEAIAMKGNLCDSPTNFMLLDTSTATFNFGTCRDVITTLLGDLFLLSTSTPAVIPATP